MLRSRALSGIRSKVMMSVAAIAAAGLTGVFAPAVANAGPHIAEYPLPNPMSTPVDIKAGGDGGIWFTETPANKLGRIDPVTKEIREYAMPQPCGPYPVTGGPQAKIWFAALSCNSIGSLDPATGHVDLFPVPSPLAFLADVKPGPDGGLWFTESVPSKIARFDPVTHGFQEFNVDLLSVPQDIAVVGSGVYYAEPVGNRIGRIDVFTHQATNYQISSTFSNVVDLDPGADGHSVWFTEAGLSRVGYLDTDTGMVVDIPLPFPLTGVTTIAAGPDGAMYFPELYLNRIGRIDPVTHVITYFPIPTSLSLPIDIGCTKAPSANPMHADPCLKDGSLWFAEALGNRIGEYKPS